ncbi:hypothetical protein Bbelb_343400 [Branchiostoma belcheri]|nr:hypothetical protein Bbelb_343400 [Branchiostoma belcheri]
MVGPCTSGFWRWMVLVLIVMTASVTGQVYPYGRGHQAFILNEQTGEVIDKAVFDTHVGGTEAAGQLTTFLEGAAAGRILAIVVHDSSSAAQVNLAPYGSTITTAALGYRESYAMITQKGAKPSWFVEKKSARGAGPTIVEAYIQACPIAGYSSFNGVCYKAFPYPKTYAEARQTCAADGGLLAMPKNGVINTFIYNLAGGGNQHRWIGLTDATVEGQWIFEDGETLSSTGYTNWGPGEPNDFGGGEDCGEMRGALWNDAPCQNARSFICQLSTVVGHSIHLIQPRPAPIYGGSLTPSASAAVNGGWTIWGAWTGCSVTCGVGTETRDRTCTNPAPENGGAECDGSAQESRSCDTGLSCPVDGGWSSWGEWSSCSVTCGYGSQSRSRTCTNPAPAYGGADCAGSAQETRQCNAGSCPVNGGWTIWGAWTGCSVTCGVGTETRDRTCTNPAPENGGAECDGSAQETRSCDTGLSCPVDGDWSDWDQWSNCSVTCGVGTETRDRTCTNPAPVNGGVDCDGSAQETRSCDTGLSCPDPWQEIFTTVKGTGQTVYYAWNASSDADVRHIKCPAVEHWESLNIQRVKVVLESSEGNVELIFDGTNTDKFSWFSKDRLLSSPWNDIKSQGQNNFSIEGTPRWKRSFYINRNFDGCPNDAGWLVVADGGPNGACQWERAPDDQLPYIRYSKTIGYAIFNGDDIATADRMVIYIDTPGNNIVCSCPSGQVVGADGTQCVDEINGCDPNPCVANAVCTDVPAPGTGATCTCGAGYEGDGNRNGTGCTGLGWGAIAGIVVGAILAVVLVTATLVFLIQKKRDGMDKEDGNVRDNDDKVYETIDDAYVASQRPGGGSDVCDVPMETLQPPAVQSRQPRGHHLQLKQQPGSGSDGYDAPMETFATPHQYENLPHPDLKMMSQRPGSGNDAYDVPMEIFQPPAVQPPQYENLPNPDPS